jgi:hypothetical protein
VWPLEISKHYYLYLETIVAARPNHRLGTWVDLMSEVSGIRQIPCYLPGELDGTSLVDKMLAIQKGYAMKDNRPATSDDWFRHLKCLSEHPRKKKVLQLAERDPEHLNPQDYIAVSYSFEPAHKSLDKHTLGFEIHNPEGMIKKFKTRDLVLQRVLRYAKKKDPIFLDRPGVFRPRRSRRAPGSDGFHGPCVQKQPLSCRIVGDNLRV